MKRAATVSVACPELRTGIRGAVHSWNVAAHEASGADTVSVTGGKWRMQEEDIRVPSQPEKFPRESPMPPMTIHEGDAEKISECNCIPRCRLRRRSSRGSQRRSQGQPRKGRSGGSVGRRRAFSFEQATKKKKNKNGGGPFLDAQFR